MAYIVTFIQDDGYGAIGCGQEFFDTLDRARAFALAELPDYNSDQDQVYIEYAESEDHVPQIIESIREPENW